jgi:hypothetical protein
MAAQIKVPITTEYFTKRLVELCLKSALTGFPKDDLDHHILLKSAVLMMGPPTDLSEKEVNEKLDLWVINVGHIQFMDHVTLRRRLVDMGYLTRKTDGSCYQVAQPGPKPEYFEKAIDQVDILAVITAAREEIARKKREYLDKSRGK